jgi:DNA-directed RNA polymerase specialized sigma24 family protein
MVTDRVAAADCARLNRLYRQWYDGGKGPIENELYTTLWQFAERYAGDDLGHDVCLRVVQRLNQSQLGQAANLPDDLHAYLYQSCKNARKDHARRRFQHVSLLQGDNSGAWAPFHLDQGQSCNGSVPERRLETFETYRKLLPTSIAKALDLDDFDVTAALETSGKRSDATKKRIQRASDKCLLTLGAAALLGHATPQPLCTLVSRLSPSLRGGAWEKILAVAPRFRDVSPSASRASAAALVQAAERRLSAFVRDREGTEAFKDSYTWLRTAALLSPEVAADAHSDLNSRFGSYTRASPLTDRLLDRIYALSGDEAAAAEGNRFWHHCLAGMTGAAKYLSDSEALFGAVYVIAYYAVPRLSRPLFTLLQPFDKTRIEHFLKMYAEPLRDSVIEQAWDNVAESIYQGGPHALVNFVRVKLGLLCLSRYNSRFGNGYARLAPETAMKLAIVAEHAAQTATNDRQLRQMAEKLRGSLIYVYDLKWRAFSRYCDRAGLSATRRSPLLLSSSNSS